LVINFGCGKVMHREEENSVGEYRNFDRQYRFAAGPAGGEGFEIGEVTAECPVPLRVNFSFQKSDLETQNTGRLTVWNLSPEHRSVLGEDDCCVSFRAGYGNKLPLIFAGIVSYSTTKKNGADEETEIEVVDNLVEIRDTFVSVSYNGTVNWKKIMEDVADQMGVAIIFSYNAEFADVANGFSFVGLARDILTKGCDCCGLSWSIQNGVIQVKRPGDVMSKEVYVLSADTGLIGIPARVVIQEDKTTAKQMGWDVEFFLNGAISVDDFVKLESELVEGYFRVYSIEYSGDNVSGDWVCIARLLEVNEKHDAGTDSKPD